LGDIPALVRAREEALERIEANQKGPQARGESGLGTTKSG